MTLNWNISMKYFHGTIKLLAPKFCLLKPPVAVNMSMLWTMFARLTRVLQNRLEDEVISCNGDPTDMRQMLPLFVLGWEKKEWFLKILFHCLVKIEKLPPIFYFFFVFLHPTYFSQQAADISGDNSFTEYALGQIEYMLGSTGRSFVCGFGNNPPTHPHHRSSSCPSSGSCDWNNFNNPGPNPQTLYGALVGGPQNQGSDQISDRRDDYVESEVTTDYNAGFQSTLAGLLARACWKYIWIE